jgi:AAA domain, putative AbiEii toxin, Type IV TA system
VLVQASGDPNPTASNAPSACWIVASSDRSKRNDQDRHPVSIDGSLVYFFDEPESALSPARQLSFLQLMHRIDKAANAQVIMATHSPILMAYPGARLLKLTKYGLEPTSFVATDHFRLMREFCVDPAAFVAAALEE